MKKKILALLALLATIFFWSIMAIMVKSVVENTSPFLLFFLRLFFAEIIFFPFFIFSQVWKKKHFPKLFKGSLLAALNLTFFMVGIKYTSASASQLIYATMPFLIFLAELFFFKKRYSWRKIFGLFLGFSGLVYIFSLSTGNQEMTTAGKLTGNIMISLGMFAWTGYLLFSKKISQYFNPLEIGSVAVLVSFFFSALLFLGEKIFFPSPIKMERLLILVGGYAGIFATFLTYLLLQYAIKNLSPLTVSLSSYLQPIATIFLAIVFLKEKITFNFLLGTSLIFLGLFLLTTSELYNHL